jgi:multiple sugar transport system substrate-binding protein
MSQHQLSRRAFLGRTGAAAAGLAFGGGALAACSSSSSSKSAGGKTVLNVMIDNVDTDQAFAPALKAFQAANDCVVKVSKFDQVKLNAALAAGSPPDLVRTSGAAEMPNIIARGLAENLDPYFAKSQYFKADDLDPIIGVYKFDGKTQGKGSIYGIPSDYSQDAMIWYRKDLLDAAGIAHPSTTDPMSYDEYLAIGKQLTKRSGGKTQVYGFDPVWGFDNQAHLMQMIAQQGGSLWSDDFTKADFTTPEARKALQWYIDWGKARTGPGPLDQESNWEGPLYDADRIAIVSYGYWFSAEILGQDAGANSAKLQQVSVFAPAPQFGSTRVDACMNGSGAWIPAKAANKDLAFKFLEAWRGSGTDGAKAHFAQGGGLPLCISNRQYLPRSSPFTSASYATQMDNLKHLSVLKFSPYAAGSAMEAALTTALTGAVQNGASLDSTVASLQAAVNGIIDSGKAQLGA